MEGNPGEVEHLLLSGGDQVEQGRYRVLYHAPSTPNEVLAEIPTDDFIRMPDFPDLPEELAHGATPRFRPPRTKSDSDPKAQRQVTVAVNRYTGVFTKIDGHRRARFWLAGELPAPESVEARVLYVYDDDEILALRGAIMPPRPQPRETKFQPYIDAGIRPTSSRLWKGHIIDSLVLACRGRPNRDQPHDWPALDRTAAVEAYAREIAILDHEVHPRNTPYPAGILGAALLTIALDPRSTLFWLSYQFDIQHPQTTEGGFTPIGALQEAVRKTLGTKRARFQSTQQELMGVALACWEAWREEFEKGSRALPKPPKPVAIDPYLKSVSAKKQFGRDVFKFQDSDSG